VKQASTLSVNESRAGDAPSERGPATWGLARLITAIRNRPKSGRAAPVRERVV